MALSTAGYRQYLLLLAQQNVEFRLPVSPRCGARGLFFFLPLGSFRGLSARAARVGGSLATVRWFLCLSRRCRRDSEVPQPLEFMQTNKMGLVGLCSSYAGVMTLQAAGFRLGLGLGLCLGAFSQAAKQTNEQQQKKENKQTNKKKETSKKNDV